MGQRGLVLVFVLVLAARGDAQFGGLSWTVGGNPAGSVSITDTELHVVGADSRPCLDQETFALAFSPTPGTVHVIMDFANHDSCIGFWEVEKPLYIVNGVSTIITDDPFFFGFTDKPVSFHVESGDAFGFGEWTLDCICGPGEITVTDFVFSGC
jgi:hypothetical protein